MPRHQSVTPTSKRPGSGAPLVHPVTGAAEREELDWRPVGVMPGADQLGGIAAKRDEATPTRRVAVGQTLAAHPYLTAAVGLAAAGGVALLLRRLRA